MLSNLRSEVQSLVIDKKPDSNSNSPDEVTVSVKDTGTGINPDIMSRLFKICNEIISRNWSGIIYIQGQECQVKFY